MADVFNLTGSPVRVTAATTQTLHTALEVADYDDLDALLGVLALEGAGSATVELITGMQTDTEAGWVSLVVFTAATGGNVYEKKAGEGVLRFVRWRVSALTATAVTFQISGMLRARSD